ncbi:MAG TPA: SDR family oxidoreductase [Polyangiaceae bacterium]
MTALREAAQRRSIFRGDLFEGQVALVTGGATGIGLAIAEELAVLGARVVIASRKTRRLRIAAAGLARDYGAEVVAMTCNIRERAAVDELVRATLERFGKIDCLVNNGGGQFPSPASAISERGFRAVIDTNLNGTWNMCQSVANQWMLGHGGRIVSIVADVARGFPGMAHTGAARAAVINFTKTLAVEWAAQGIRINAVAPGVILSTGMHNYPPGTADLVVRSIPQKRLGTVEEVAASVLYLLSERAGFVTGATLNIDGGGSLWGDMWPIPDPEQPVTLAIPPWPEERWPELAQSIPETDA